jgi:hypothetical protein
MFLSMYSQKNKISIFYLFRGYSFRKEKIKILTIRASLLSSRAYQGFVNMLTEITFHGNTIHDSPL